MIPGYSGNCNVTICASCPLLAMTTLLITTSLINRQTNVALSWAFKRLNWKMKSTQNVPVYDMLWYIFFSHFFPLRTVLFIYLTLAKKCCYTHVFITGCNREDWSSYIELYMWYRNWEYFQGHEFIEHTKVFGWQCTSGSWGGYLVDVALCCVCFFLSKKFGRQVAQTKFNCV